MATKSPNAPLTAKELDFWAKAFLGAELKLLSSHRNHSILGVVHLMSDFAWDALDAYRKAAQGDRS